jgi:hypothetical protein
MCTQENLDMDIASVESMVVAIRKEDLIEILKSQDEARQSVVDISAFKLLKEGDVNVILTFDPSELIEGVTF